MASKVNRFKLLTMNVQWWWGEEVPTWSAIVIDPFARTVKVETLKGENEGLADMQRIVGGYVETLVEFPIGPNRVAVIMGDEEGRLKGVTAAFTHAGVGPFVGRCVLCCYDTSRKDDDGYIKIDVPFSPAVVANHVEWLHWEGASL